MRFDLHIHSCLSPCGDLEMSPRAIVERARAAGLDGIALTDHNSARNTPALEECACGTGLRCLFGLEINTAEELHTLALFDTTSQALEMTGWVYDGLPKRVNQPEVFGDQPVVDADETIIELEWRLLSAATRHPLHAISAEAHRLGGLLIACHVDRPVFSVFARLGVLSGDEGFDAMELGRTALESEWRTRTLPHPLIRSSDSHYLADVGTAWTEADLSEFSIAELRAAFLRGTVVPGPPWQRTK